MKKRKITKKDRLTAFTASLLLAILSYILYRECVIWGDDMSIVVLTILGSMFGLFTSITGIVFEEK